MSWWEPHFEGMCYMHGICLICYAHVIYLRVAEEMGSHT